MVSDVSEFTEKGTTSTLALNLHGTTGFFNSGDLVFSICELGEGCACSMLSDDADWNHPFWDFRPEVLKDLASLLTRIGESVIEELSVEALWAGDESRESIYLSLPQLEQLVLKNQIGTKTQYRVLAS
ncbi:MAG: hypothetical protein IPG22_10165 [Acidobacteria bacterium]|nr:hypothetical protein [Acidobacteriota bacterium]